jgi:integrase/recombinase XerD
MILLAVLAGLRVHEIAEFRGEDIDPDARTLRVTGKGGRTDTIPLPSRPTCTNDPARLVVPVE